MEIINQDRQLKEMIANNEVTSSIFINFLS